jgi:T5orf172 domain
MPRKNKTLPVQAGFLYLFVNKYMNCIAKIGLTGTLKKRKDNLYYGDSGVPYPFELKNKVYVDDIIGLEKSIHSLLNGYRINNNREFFGFEIDFEDETIDPRDVYKKFKSEIIEPVNQIMDCLRKQYPQPDDLNEIKTDENTQNKVSSDSDKNILSSRDKTRIKKIQFVKTCLKYYNQDKMLFVKTLFENNLPPELSKLNPRKNNTFPTKESAYTWVHRINELTK